jgi:hypothetical protein
MKLNSLTCMTLNPPRTGKKKDYSLFAAESDTQDTSGLKGEERAGKKLL